MRAKTNKLGGAIAKTNNRKRFWLTMMIIAILGCFSGVAVGMYFVSNKLDPNRYNYDVATLSDDVGAIRREAKGKTPMELGAIKSGVLAFDTTFNYECLQIIGVGEIKASVVTQSINAKTVRMGDKLYSENISVSSIVKALNRYYVDGDQIIGYGGSISGNTVTWDPNPISNETMDEYKAKYNSTMYEYMKYIISSKTVNNATEVTKNAEGNYVFTLTLDKSKSVVNYVKTMKDTGGLSEYPNFTSDPIVTLTIDEQYRIIEFKSTETYNAKIGIITAGSSATLTNTFTYDQDFVIPGVNDKSYI